MSTSAQPKHSEPPCTVPASSLSPLSLVRHNVKLAQAMWPTLRLAGIKQLEYYSREFEFSISVGDLVLLERGWYVTHSGLVGLTRRKGCHSIRTRPVPAFCDIADSRWLFKATVRRSPTCGGFVGYGDADPSNVSPFVRGAEMRVAGPAL